MKSRRVPLTLELVEQRFSQCSRRRSSVDLYFVLSLSLSRRCFSPRSRTDRWMEKALDRSRLGTTVFKQFPCLKKRRCLCQHAYRLVVGQMSRAFQPRKGEACWHACHMLEINNFRVTVYNSFLSSVLAGWKFSLLSFSRDTFISPRFPDASFVKYIFKIISYFPLILNNETANF